MNQYLLILGVIHQRILRFGDNWRDQMPRSIQYLLMGLILSQLFMIKIHVSQLNVEHYEYLFDNLFHPISILCVITLAYFLMLFCWYTVLAGKVTKNLIEQKMNNKR